MPRRLLLGWLGSLWSLLLVMPLHATDFVVVVHKDNQSVITQQLLLQLYLNKTAAFANGKAATLLHLPRTSTEHQQFCLELLNLTAHQYQSYWSRLVFTGNANSLMFADADAVLQQVQRNPSAIAYLPATIQLSGVRQLGFLRDGQWQAASAAY
jgi:ABC-type phosphate transport system substrate-binding protein